MNKRKLSSILLSLSMAAIMVLGAASMSFACTSMYYGGDTTENGSTFIGRSEDSSWTTYRKCYTVHEAADHAEGEMYVSNSTDFTMEYPAHTYRYTMVKDVSKYASVDAEEMAQVGTNEMGVAVSASVTLTRSKKEVSAVDPMVGTGLCEEDIPSVILMQASTARDGAQKLIDIYENIGAGGVDMTAIIDDTECWIVQSLSGHVAVAVLCPPDKVGTTPNISANVDLGNEETTIATSGIITVAEQAGTLVLDDQGNIKIADSYSRAASFSNRLYNCYQYLKGSDYADSLEAAGGYIDYFHEPKDGKYSTFEILRSLCYRGEGGKYYAADSTGNGIGIGNDNNLETHFFESRKGMPYELAVIQWESLGPAEFGCYLPGYNALITDTIEANKVGLDTMTYNYENPELNNFRAAYFELYFLCKGRDNQDGLKVGTLEARTKYGSHVKEFWEAYQKELIAQQAVIDDQMIEILAYDKALAEQKATELNMHLQAECLSYIETMVNELKAFESEPQEGEYVPSCMGALPTYSFDAIGGTGLPENTEPTVEETKVSFLQKMIKVAYTGKPVKLTSKDVSVEGSNGKVTFKFYKDKSAKKEIKAPVKPGAYYAKAFVAATDGYSAGESDVVKVIVNKGVQKIVKVGPASKTFKASKIKKAKATFHLKAVTKGNGKLSCKKVSGNKKITVSKSGNVTIKMGLKKGTYKIKIKFTKAANANYTAKTETKTIKIIIK